MLAGVVLLQCEFLHVHAHDKASVMSQGGFAIYLTHTAARLFPVVHVTHFFTIMVYSIVLQNSLYFSYTLVKNSDQFEGF
jgi:hypothetical protein